MFAVQLTTEVSVFTQTNYCRKHLTPQKYPRKTVSFKNRRKEYIQTIFMNHSLMPLTHISRDSRSQKQLKQQIPTKELVYICASFENRSNAAWDDTLSPSLCHSLEGCRIVAFLSSAHVSIKSRWHRVQRWLHRCFPFWTHSSTSECGNLYRLCLQWQKQTNNKQIL